MIGEIVYKPIKSFFDKAGQRLAKYGISPTQVTIAGMLITALGGFFYAYGGFVVGSFIIWFAALFDLLDGSLARSSGKETPFGAFIDSVVDRSSDFFIFGGLLIYFARTGQHGKFAFFFCAE